MNKLSPESGDGSQAASTVNTVTAAVTSPAALPQMPVAVHAEPKAGGSYTRDPATGALTKVAGPVPDDQPATE